MEKPWELFEKAPPLVRLLGTSPDRCFQVAPNNENTRYAIRSDGLKDCQYIHSSSSCTGCQYILRCAGLQNVKGYVGGKAVTLETWALAVAAVCIDILSEEDHDELMEWVKSRGLSLRPHRLRPAEAIHNSVVGFNPELTLHSSSACARLTSPKHTRRGRIALLAMGSRGDIQPSAAVAIGLQAAGYTVRMFVPSELLALVHALGIDAQGVPPGWLGFDIVSVVTSSGEYEEAIYKGVVDFSPELILYNNLACVEAWVLTESTGALTMHYTYIPSGLHEYPLWRSKMGHCVHFDRLLGRRTLQGWNAAQVKDHSGGKYPMLCALSRHLADASTATSLTHSTGFWILDAEQQNAQLEKNCGFFGGAEQQQQELAQFLEAGEPPVYMGWGSMPVDRDRTSQLAVRALAKTGKRAIVVGGLAGLAESALHSATDADELLRYAREHVLWIQSAAHEVLMPSCSMAVIHGGAGTTAAALRAGLPCVVTPFAFDQPLWAGLVEAKGVGKATRGVAEVTAGELADAMTRCMEPRVRAAVARMAGHLRQEHGIENAVGVIKDFLKSQGGNTATATTTTTSTVFAWVQRFVRLFF